MKSKYTPEQIREARSIIATVSAEKANRVIAERYTPEEISALRKKANQAGLAVRKRKKAERAALCGAPA